MERTYNVGLFQDSSGRDLKSAQNTPSRQPLAPPNPANQGQASMAPPPLQSQDNRTSVLAGQDFSKKVDIIQLVDAIYLVFSISILNLCLLVSGLRS